jgi:hypothetical protein
VESSKRMEKAVSALEAIGWSYSPVALEWSKTAEPDLRFDNDTVRLWIERNMDRCIEGYLRAFPGCSIETIATVFGYKVPKVRKATKLMLLNNVAYFEGQGSGARWHWRGA